MAAHQRRDDFAARVEHYNAQFAGIPPGRLCHGRHGDVIGIAASGRDSDNETAWVGDETAR
jgi:hypothetical protein